MPNIREPNRIEVDLKLLQDEQLKVLRAITDDFRSAADKLAIGIGDQSQRLAAASRMATPGQPSASASTVRKTAEAFQPANASSSSTGNYRFGPDPAAGLAPIGPVKLLLERVAQKKFSPEEYFHELNQRGSNAAYRGLGQAGAIASKPKVFIPGIIGWHTLSPLINPFSAQGPAQFGLQAGQSGHTGASGIFGYLWSDAFRRGLSLNFDVLKRSRFGLNPLYSTAQAREALNTLSEYGYTTEEGGTMGHNRMANLLQNITQTTGLSAKGTMPLLDQAARFGTSSLSSVTQGIYDLAAAARATHMNLQQLESQIASLAPGISDQTGISVGNVADTLRNYSMVTGQSPSEGTSLLSRQNILLTAAKTGKDYYSLTHGGAGSALYSTQLGFVEGQLGMSVESYNRLWKTDPKRARQIYDQVYPVLSDPSFRQYTSALNLPQLLSGNLGARNTLRNYRVMDALTQAQNTGHFSAGGLQSALNELGMRPGSKTMRAFQHDTYDFLKQHHGDKKLLAEHQATYLINKMGDHLSKVSKQAAHVALTIGLTPEAKRFIRVMENNMGGKPTSNSRGTFAAAAADFGTGLLRDAGAAVSWIGGF